MTGQTVAHYRVLEKLGEGGMGVVYKARDTHLDRFVAIKILPPGKVSDPERRRRFVQEAKAASALNNPHIVTIYDIDSVDGVLFIAMEYIEGRTLEELIRLKGLPLSDAMSIAIQIADALAAAHAAGIVHRDLKPSNIMAGEDGRVRVLDFGLAKLTEPVISEDAATQTLQAVTEEGAILGTVNYMSPEQAEGKTVDTRSDIFSFGLVLYEMLSRQHPFRRESKVSTLAAMINEEPKPLAEVAAGLTPELERTVLRCLRKQPSRRWQSMSDLKSVLEDLKEDSQSRTSSPAVSASPARQRGWSWALWVGLAAVATAAGLLLVWGLRRPAGGDLELSRLTFDSGVSMHPSISADGKIFAYASDRGGEGKVDVWVRHIDRPSPTRVTNDPASASMPSISPDGSRIVFRSERGEGGVYIKDTFGGEERKLADHGIFPRFSPDGKWIAFVRQPAVPYSSAHKLYLVSPEGGVAKPFHPEFGSISMPQGIGAIWSPDSRHVLFKGVRTTGGKPVADWWVAPVDGGAPTSAGAPKTLITPEGVFLPCAWPVEDKLLYTEGVTIQGVNLFQAGISPRDRKVFGDPVRLTSGPGMRYDATVSAGGTMLFSILNWVPNVWSMPLDANSGAASGEARQLTEEGTTKVGLSASRDGKKLAYMNITGSVAALRCEVRVRDLSSMKETTVADWDRFIRSVLLSPGGEMIAYYGAGPEGVGGYVVRLDGSERRRICENCRVAGFFPGLRDALVQVGNQLARQPIAGGTATPLMTVKAGSIYDASLSDDGRWVAFTQTKPDGRAAIYVAPVRDAAVDERECMLISESPVRWIYWPVWSPDGNLLYFLAELDGRLCVWARRLEAGTKKPLGDPFGVYHAHTTRRGMWGPRGFAGFGVAKDRLFVLQADNTSSIWMGQLDLKR